MFSRIKEFLKSIKMVSSMMDKIKHVETSIQNIKRSVDFLSYSNEMWDHKFIYLESITKKLTCEKSIADIVGISADTVLEDIYPLLGKMVLIESQLRTVDGLLVTCGTTIAHKWISETHCENDILRYVIIEVRGERQVITITEDTTVSEIKLK